MSFTKDTKLPTVVGSATPEPQSQTPTPGQSKKEEGGGEEKAEDEAKPEPKVDGIIGQLEVYRNGAVKMRLGNGIVYDVRLFLLLSLSRVAIVLSVDY